ncbi:TonB-dependent receptor [Prolixibacteraceae bacterium]|nr:TonB-dependent receptor [Prolixibacteraceae bacterium]
MNKQTMLKIKRRLWKEHRIILFMGLLLFSVLPTFADQGESVHDLNSGYNTQQTEKRVVKGRVVDENGEPMPGVTVFIKETKTGTVTDFDGNFTIKTTRDAVIEFSMVGFESRKEPLAGKTWIEVSLKSKVADLDEVVVVAYGTKKKATITGALSTVETEELVRSPSTSVANSLAGVMPGVTTIQSSSQPGKDAAEIYIRGAGSPLVLVDGVERSFTDLDPNEIASISILKDASSTAVFGVRGANGVILVTTRQGVVGKPQISFTTSIGLEKPDHLYQSASSYDYARHWNYMMDADGAGNKFSSEAIEAFRTGSDPLIYPSVDWADYMFNDYYMQSKNNISITGGTKKVQYFISLGYQYQNGLMKSMEDLQGYDNNFNNNRYNYRSNITVNLTESTKMKVNLGGVYNKLQDPIIVTGLNKDLNHRYNRPFIYGTRWTLPFASPGFVDGKHYKLKAGRKVLPTGFGMREGIWALYGYGYRNVNSNKLNLDIDISQDLSSITKGLQASVKGAYNVRYETIKAWRGSQPTYYPSYTSTLESPTMEVTDPNFNKDIIIELGGTKNDLYYAEKSSRKRDWYLEGRVNYNRTFGNHSIGTLLLYNLSRTYYPSTFKYIPLSYIGYVGRLTYDYKQKYLLDISMGYNGSENFAPGDTRYGFFPSVSGGWVVSEEKLAKKLNLFSYLKVRGSYGQVGNDKGGKRFLYMPEIWNSEKGISFGVDNTVLQPSYIQGPIGNSEVTWETATKMNLGVDLKLFQNKLSINADIFSEQREGILIAPKSTPGIIVTKSPILNIGKRDNKGYELMVGWSDYTHKDFQYNLSASLSYARNTIIDNDELPSDYPWQLEEGGSTKRGPVEYMYQRLYQKEDFIKDSDGKLRLNPELPQPSYKVSPGDAKYQDINGDHVVNDIDKKVWGYSSVPEYTMGFNSTLTYKKWTLFMQWTGVTNVNKMAHVGHRQIFGNPKNMGLNQMWVDNVWTPDRTDAPWPKATKSGMAWNGAESTLWDLDASYVRLKNLSLTYDMNANSKIFRAIGIKKAAITVSGYNLFTFSKLDYFDPEGSDITNWDGAYPLTRIYNCSLRVNF